MNYNRMFFSKKDAYDIKLLIVIGIIFPLVSALVLFAVFAKIILWTL